MEKIKSTIQEILKLAGFVDFSVDLDEGNRKLTIFINEGDWFNNWAPRLIGDLSHLTKVLAKKHNTSTVFVDINNYRKERENIIIDLAKAAARKVIITKDEIRLPAMNAYERRLIHIELAARPDVMTESEGEGIERRVIVRPL